MKRIISDLIKRIGVMAVAGALIFASVPANVYAETTSDVTTNNSYSTTTTPDGDVTVGNLNSTTSWNTTSTISDDDRAAADQELLNHYNSLKIRYALESAKNLDEIFNSAVYYIAYTEMTKAQLETYVAGVKNSMNAAAAETASSVTTQYLQVADNWVTPNVSYGQTVTIVLPIINLGTEEIKDIVIEPQVTSDVKTWPFVPGKTGYIQTEPYIPGYINDDQAFANRREFTYTFTVRDDVMTGFYELKFLVSYTRAGVRVEDEKASVLSVYVHTTGKAESGYIGGNGNEDKVAKSRIIVTGYETDTDKVFSGDTFNLTIHVQNTSSDTTVTNVLFNINAGTETTGSGNTSETITPFLPTSGSNSVYMEKISPKEVTDINIEMSAKAGLSQKSYVLELNMTYDSGMQFDLTDKASISIPVYQESKFDTSNPEVTPSSVNVGAQSDVMFSIYNTGKTTLYNVQVQFHADSIENNMAFIGNLASGATGNVDVMITGVSPTMDDGTINVDISYEDEAGNVTVVPKTITLFVNDDSSLYMDDMMGGGMRLPEEEESENSKVPVRLIIVIIVILAVVGLVIFFVRRGKKKREAALLADDLKDLEALEEVVDETENSSNEQK